MGGRGQVAGASALTALIGIALVAMAVDSKESSVIGNWLSESKDGIIQISQGEGGAYEGRIIGGNHPGRLDEKNPDPAQRAKALRGEVILRGLHYDGDGKWSGGAIYEPDTGRTYKCLVELVTADSIKVRGFIGISLLGKSQTWTRYRGTSMDLPAAP
jgi:uncharacterized protein (DUF2147 family)